MRRKSSRFPLPSQETTLTALLLDRIDLHVEVPAGQFKVFEQLGDRAAVPVAEAARDVLTQSAARPSGGTCPGPGLAATAAPPFPVP